MSQSIEGGVVIINTLSTKNNGDYPLVMAESVEMENGKNVEDEINEITENISGIIDDAKSSQTTTWSSENIISQLCPPFEVSGSIVTCQPVVGSQLNMLVQIEPVQEGEGTPSTENVRPIHGWDSVTICRGGKNLWGGRLFKAQYMSGIPYITEYEDITFPYNPAYATEGLAVILPVSAYQTFTFKAHEANENATYRYAIYVDFESAYNYENKLEYKTVLSNTSFTVSSSGIMVFMIGGAWTSDNDKIHVFTEEEKFQLELGDTSTAYESYRGETFTIPTSEMVYGGTLDVTTGVLTVTHIEHVEDGSRNFGLSFLPVLVFDFFSEEMKGIFGSRIISNMFGAPNNLVWGSGSARQISLNVTGTPLAELSTNEEFKSYFKGLYDAGNPATFVYELANPVTIQLTPTEIYALSSVNTVYADTGDVTVSGYSDPTVIIQSLADRIAALESAATSLIINELDYN